MTKLKTFGTILLAGSLAPAGLLYAQPPATTASAMASTAGYTSSSSMNTSAQAQFTKIHNLAQDVRKDVAPLKFGINGTELSWRVHSIKLAKAKKSVNQLEKKVRQLDRRQTSLTPWQRQLLSNVKEDAHEMVYQTAAAIKVLKKYQNSSALAATSYPQDIGMIWQRANDATDSITDVFQRHGADMD